MQTDLLALSQLGMQRQYRAGAVILTEGELGDAMYILLLGQVRVFAQSIGGKEITYGKIDAGEYFGEMSLDGGRRSASVQAVGEVLCAVVPNSVVLSFVQTHPDFSIQLLHTVIGRARKATDTARDVALLDVYARLAQALERLSASQGLSPDPGGPGAPGGLPLHQPIKTTHQELASTVGASREMVSKLMKDLERGGYIHVDKLGILIQKKLPLRW